MSNEAPNEILEKDNINLYQNKKINKEINIKKHPNYNLVNSNKNQTFDNNQNNKNKSNYNIYKKPLIKLNDYISKNNSLEENNNNYKINQILDDNINNKIERNNIKDTKIREITNNLKENEIKIEKVNKTMFQILHYNNNEDFINNRKNEYEIDKIQQENLTLKADSIIYREDIIHLSEINKKLKEELEIEKRKINNLISKGEEEIQILNNKNYEITQLTEVISNLKISNNPDIINKFKGNKTKENIIYELQFKLNNLNNDKIKNETEKKILEEQYNNIINENKIIEKEDELE